MIAHPDAALPRVPWTGRIVGETDAPRDAIANAALEAEIDAERSVYIGQQADDVDALRAADFDAELAGVPGLAGKVSGLLIGAADPLVILVGDVPHTIGAELAAEVPGLTVRRLAVDSPALALGWCGSVTSWSPDEADAAHRTWIQLAAGAVAEVDGVPGEPIELPPDSTADRWPAPMSSAIRIGLIGELLDLVEPQTEADPAAIVADFMVRFGNCIGRGPHFTVSGDRHGCNVFAAIAGKTGQGRKGSSGAYPRRVFALADADWSAKCCKTGLSSGEGIIYSVRDASDTGRVDKEGQPIGDPGVEDKRLHVMEPELARTLKAASRRDSTLGPILRQAWDGVPLATMTKVPYSAKDAHVSLLAHVTAHELKSLLRDDDIHGGTCNRFLFVASRRQRQLPFGGEVDELALAGIGKRLQRLLATARDRGEIGFTDLAFECWPGVYGRLLRDEQAPGIGGALLARAVAQTRRLAALFALIDGAGDVDVTHLDAAVEMWRYSRETIEMIFGTSTGDRIADRLLGELRGTPKGIDRTAMHHLFDRHATAEDINAALVLLQQQGLATGRRIKTGGRPRETWTATR